MADIRRGLLPSLRAAWESVAARHFETLFVLAVLVSVAGLGWAVEDKLAFLSFYFIPVLLAGYFLDARSAVLGGVLSVLWVALLVLLQPDSFEFSDRRSLVLHLVPWGSFLILSGALVGSLNEQVLDKLARLRLLMGDWRKSLLALDESQKTVEEKNQALEALRAKLETVLYSSMDAVTAHITVSGRLASETRELTVLCAEFPAVAAAADLQDPEAVVERLNGLLGRLEPVVTSYHGHLDRFAGASLRAEFGVPVATPYSPLQAVLAGLQLQKKAAQERLPWKMRLGIAHGKALVGLIGTGTRRSYTVLGGLIRLAEAVEREGAAGSVCVDAGTHGRVAGAFLTRPLFTGGASGSGARGTAVATERAVRTEDIYEILALKDPFDDDERLPTPLAESAERLFRAEGLKPDMLLPLEAMMGGLGHSRVTAVLSFAAAEALGLPAETKRAAFLAGFYHEIGARSRRPGQTGAHATDARAALSDLGIALPPEALEAIAQHQENLDGSGPLGLSEPGIGIAARLVRLAHEYDTMTSWRPERSAWSPVAALTTMRLDSSMAGRLDSRAFDAFLRVVGGQGRK